MGKSTITCDDDSRFLTCKLPEHFIRLTTVLRLGHLQNVVATPDQPGGDIPGDALIKQPLHYETTTISSAMVSAAYRSADRTCSSVR